MCIVNLLIDKLGGKEPWYTEWNPTAGKHDRMIYATVIEEINVILSASLPFIALLRRLFSVIFTSKFVILSQIRRNGGKVIASENITECD